ncbi:MAG: TRAP transporter small permease [Firmicutes bacterium]|nr:TRAP transporter small permease [Bacillota bacterium]
MDILSWTEETVMEVSALAITLLTAGESINRYFIKVPLPWYEEIVQFLYMMLVFWGASRLVRDNEHLKLELVTNALKGRAKLAYEASLSLVCTLISALGVYYGLQITMRNSGSTVYLRIPNRVIFGLSLFLGFAAMTIRYGQRFASYARQLTSEKRSPKGCREWRQTP